MSGSFKLLRTTAACPLTLAVCLLAWAPAILPAQAPTGRNLALLVGVKSYQNKPLPPLAYTENDVVELAKQLQNAEYSTIVLCDSAGEKDKDLLPTHANIRARLKELLKDCTAKDTVLIALAGHGLQFDKSQTSYFCPCDAKTDDKTTLIPLKDLYTELENSHAGVKIVLVDACRNDPSTGRGLASDEDATPPKGIIAMFSCSAGQRAYETAKYKHGLFFHHVLEALRHDENQDERGQLTWDRLAGYVSRRVTEEAPQLVGTGVHQEPHIIAEVTGASPVVYRPKESIRKAQECKKRGLKAHADNQNEKAVREFAEAIRLNPSDASLYAARAQAFLALHEFDLSRQDFTSAMDRSVSSVDLMMGRAEVYFQNYQLKLAVQDLTEAILLDPQAAPAYQKRSFCYFLLQEDERGLKDIDTAIQLSQDDPVGYAYRAAILIRKRNFERAWQDCQTALRLDSTCALALNCRGLVYFNNKDQEHALKDLDRAIQVDPGCVFPWLNRGMLYAVQGKYDRAMKDVDKGLELSPRLAEGHCYRAIVLSFQGAMEEAMASASKALEIQPRHADALAVRGTCYFRKGDADRAGQDFEAAVSIRPDHADALQGRGLIAFLKKDYDRALKDFDRSIEAGGIYPVTYDFRAKANIAKKNYEEALRDFSKVVELDPKYAVAYNNRGFLYATIKSDTTRALRDYNQALKLEPNNIIFLSNRCRLHQSLGNQAEAAADYERIERLKQSPQKK